ncbi:MAG: DNA-binding protein WhiA [Lachnospiraceae bacterium]|nr:DNA-binding protein WhiA [Lachnospiraceae bacterium]
MSFSGDVKEELLSVNGNGRHCQIAELAAYFSYCGFVKKSNSGHMVIGITAENKAIATKCFTLIKKTFNIYSGILIRKHSFSSKILSYEIQIEKPDEIKEVLMAIKKYKESEEPLLCSCVDKLLLKKDCCRRAFIRGTYLAIGSMSNPEKGYHMEFVFDHEDMAEEFIQILKTFSIGAKMVLRKKNYVVYIKDGEEIVDMLNITGAHISLMNLENTRIMKDMRNSINRRVNCETANIAKTVNAATKQVEDIMFIRKNYGLHKLPDNLRQVAEVRLAYPEASLVELSQLMDPPVGKSGVNHRLRKLSELAERLRVN